MGTTIEGRAFRRNGYVDVNIRKIETPEGKEFISKNAKCKGRVHPNLYDDSEILVGSCTISAEFEYYGRKIPKGSEVFFLWPGHEDREKYGILRAVLSDKVTFGEKTFEKEDRICHVSGEDFSNKDEDCIPRH